jgi:signal transduction histidine kinase
MGPDAPPETLEEELQILDDEAAACQRIAEDLVAYARAPELRRSSIAMDQLLRETVRRFQEASDAGGIEIALDLTPGGAWADGGRLRQVFLNLMWNAAQVSAADGRIDVCGAPAEDGSYVVLISDRGPGISPEDRSKIFEPFFTKRPGGSGLGLALCQGIVRAHAGHIAAEDRDGGGATFRVEIPGAPPAAREKA